MAVMKFFGYTPFCNVKIQAAASADGLLLGIGTSGHSVLHAFTQYIQPAGQHLIIRFTPPEPLRINLTDLV